MSKRGYTIALDDFVYTNFNKSLIEHADIIKIDVMNQSREKTVEEVTRLKEFDVKLLAEKVETHEEYEFLKTLGFDYFQGYFFAKPKVVKSRRIPANRIATMRILGALQSPKVSMDELEHLITNDVTLSFKILKCINSASFSLNRKIESIQQAIVYMGLKHIKHWATLIVLSGLDDKPKELIVLSLMRSKMCELVAKAIGIKEVSSSATVGLFSTLDAMMDAPMDELLTQLPLADEVKLALDKRQGPLGKVLNNVIAYDMCQWDIIDKSDIDHSILQESYLKAITWTTSIVNEM